MTIHISALSAAVCVPIDEECEWLLLLHLSGVMCCWDGNSGCRFYSTVLVHCVRGNGRASGESDRSEMLADREDKLFLCERKRESSYIQRLENS